MNARTPQSSQKSATPFNGPATHRYAALPGLGGSTPAQSTTAPTALAAISPRKLPSTAKIFVPKIPEACPVAHETECKKPLEDLAGNELVLSSNASQGVF